MAFHKYRALAQFVDIDGHGWEAGQVWEGNDADYTAYSATLTQAVTDGHIVADDSGPDYAPVVMEDQGVGTEQEAVKEPVSEKKGAAASPRPQGSRGGQSASGAPR